MLWVDFLLLLLLPDKIPNRKHLKWGNNFQLSLWVQPLVLIIHLSSQPAWWWCLAHAGWVFPPQANLSRSTQRCVSWWFSARMQFLFDPMWFSSETFMKWVSVSLMLKAAVERSSWPSRLIIPAVHRGIWLLLELLVHSLSCSWRNSLTAVCPPEFSSTLHISSRAHWRSAKLKPPTTIFYPFLWTLYWRLQNFDGEWAPYQGSYEDEDVLNWILLTQNSISFLIHYSEAAELLCICELNSLL